MVTLAQKLRVLFPGADEQFAWRVKSDGGVESIWQWNLQDPQPTAQQLADAELPCAKALAVAANRAEAGRRILSKYSDARQRSAALGVYPAAYVTQMQADIASVIAAENAAADLIDACTTVAQVAAVTVNWPTL